MMATTWLTVLCFVLATTNIALGDTEPTIVKVTTVLTEPFARYVSLTALPHELEGYIPDLLGEIEKDPDLTDIKFFITPVEDGKYGAYVRNSWTGLIRKLKDGESDMAAAPLTKNDQRDGVVDFIEPAFMTFELAMLMKRDVSDVKSFADLSKEGQTKYTIGVVEGGSTAAYFRLNQLYYVIQSKLTKTGNVENVEEGVKRVRDSTGSHPYIFIGEQHMLEYHASQKPCDLTVVKGNATGSPAAPEEYQLAIRKDYRPANLKQKLQSALVKLNETGKLDELYNKWWKERSQCKGTPEKPSNSSSTVITSMAAILVPILFAVLSRLSGE